MNLYMLTPGEQISGSVPGCGVQLVLGCSVVLDQNGNAMQLREWHRWWLGLALVVSLFGKVKRIRVHFYDPLEERVESGDFSKVKLDKLL